jgi:serine/threonine-protein kinase
MTLEGGQRLGPYEILSPLGAGGMGEVYRARDTKLGRDVALKVLPQAFASDSERMARFQREAQVLASLNHPHIASLYGLEDSDTNHALVMELVPGSTLAERIERGAIPLEEALPLAMQIAEAVEYAHEHGIVHRDLKPANVKLTNDGAVKVLDFGLAKALCDDPLSPDVTNSPTLSAVATRAGIILGTAAYMSPEQAKGRTADRRSDVWSFGVVLFEMLTGRRLYRSETANETLALVLTQEPDFGALPGTTPSRVRQLLRRCLTKDPRRRLRDIGEARITIEDLLAGRDDTAAADRPGAPFWPRAAALAGAAALLAAGLTPWARWRHEPPAAIPVRLSVELGTDAPLKVASLVEGPAAILSPDGKLLVFRAQKAASEPPRLYVRRLEQLQAAPLSGTEGARDHFFSPDSQWIAFFADGKLKKIAVTGGAAVTLCDAMDDRGGTWSEDGTILFAPQANGGLLRVSSAGGNAEAATTPDPGDGGASHRWPQALPGGQAVLFTAGTAGDFENGSIVAQSLPQGPKKVVHRGGYHGRYLASGHLVYMHEGTLFAAPFDLGRLELRGPSSPVIESVMAASGSGGTQLAFSDRGRLVFLPGRSAGAVNVPILWMDKEGNTQPLRPQLGNYNNVRFSPDGRRLAMDIQQGREADVWVYEWGRDAMSRLTFEAGPDTQPVWTADGRRIAFASAREDKVTPNIYWQRADGTGEAQRLTESKNPQAPASWHPSGRFLAFTETDPKKGADVMILPMEGDEASGFRPGKPAVFLSTAFFEAAAAFSPDGKWLAYRSNESGSPEVYVRPFPGPGGKWQVSTGGASFPSWRGNRNELLYRALDERLMLARFVAENDSFRPDKPRQWSGLVPRRGGLTSRSFDLHPDGQRVAVLKSTDRPVEENHDHVVLVENIFEELRRVAPVTKP